MKNLFPRPQPSGSAGLRPRPNIAVMGVIVSAVVLPTLPLRGDAVPAGSFRWGGACSPNMASSARNLPADPGNTVPLWEIKTGTHQYSIPTLDRGRILVAANDAGIERAGFEAAGGGVVMCVAQATGKLIWQLPIPRYLEGVKAPYHFDQWNCGVCSGPVVDGNRVYVVSSRGEILCLDIEGQATLEQFNAIQAQVLKLMEEADKLAQVLRKNRNGRPSYRPLGIEIGHSRLSSAARDGLK